MPKEQLFPPPDASDNATYSADLIISWDAPGHGREYLVNLPSFVGVRDYEAVIPTAISNDIQARLGEQWSVSNRGSRIEVHSKPFGQRDDEFVVGAVTKYVDELIDWETNRVPTVEEKVDLIITHLRGRVTLLKAGLYEGMSQASIDALVERYENEIADFEKLAAEGIASGNLSFQSFEARYQAVKKETEVLYDYEAGGLSDEHAAELNGLGVAPKEARQARYASLREQYADNPLALEQIDVFDKSSPYGVALKEYVQVIKNGDSARTWELECWFAEHYPLLEARATQ